MDRELAHLRNVEEAVRRMRWLGLVVLPVLVVAFRPPAGVELPLGKPAFVAIYAVALLGLNAGSTAVLRRGRAGALRRFGVVSIAATTLLALGVVVVFGVDPTSRFWPLLVVPILEGASRYGLSGALWVWTAASAGYVGEQAWRLLERSGDAGSWLSAMLWGVAILLIVAGGAGTLAARSDRDRQRAMRQNARLRGLADASRALSSSREPQRVFEELLDAARRLTGARRATFHERLDDGTWTVRAASGEAVRGGGPDLEQLAAGADADEPVVVDGDGPGHDRTVVLVRAHDRVRGAIVLDGRPTLAAGAEVSELLGLLAAHGGVALETAALVEAEEQRSAELARLDALKDDFLSILSHEMRSPMTAMAGYAHLLRDRWDRLTPERRDGFLDQIVDASHRLSRLIGDVLDATRAERSELTLSPEPLDLEAVAREVAEQEVGPSSMHTLEVRVSPPVPRVVGDGDRLRQVLHNLLSNAVKYSPDGGRVSLDLRRDGDRVLVTVADDGLGIPEDEMPHLFGKFHRVPTGRRIDGTGLGLYVTRMLVEAMGGTIAARSTPGSGSAFTVGLPAAVTDDVPEADEALDAEPTGSAG